MLYDFCCHGSSETTVIACVQHLPKPGSKGRLGCRGKRAPGQRDNDLQSHLMQCNFANTLDCTGKEFQIRFRITVAATVCLRSTKMCFLHLRCFLHQRKFHQQCFFRGPRSWVKLTSKNQLAVTRGTY